MLNMVCGKLAASYRAALGLLLVSGAATADSLPSTNPDELPQLRPGLVAGYIERDDLVNSLTLLPRPPAEDSAAYAADDATREAMIALRGTPRWDLAIRDADFRSADAVNAFACPLGFRITPEETPHLNMLLRRSLVDSGLATYRAKEHYSRTRPFVAANDDTICTPDSDQALREDGSYPSGHASIGWAWALILSEMVPEKANEILRRGYDFGQSRVVCGVHWQSDVNAGRVVASAAVAQLHTNPDFRAQFGAAQAEAQAMLAASNADTDCSLEEAAHAE